MAQITHYDQGDLWTPKATFTVGGVATDPSTVTFKYRDPSGTITTVGPVAGASGGSGITRVSAGVYTYDVTLNDAGRWYARFEGTAPRPLRRTTKPSLTRRCSTSPRSSAPKRW
jgi:hypothetical protein